MSRKSLVVRQLYMIHFFQEIEKKINNKSEDNDKRIACYRISMRNVVLDHLIGFSFRSFYSLPEPSITIIISGSANIRRECPRQWNDRQGNLLWDRRESLLEQLMLFNTKAVNTTLLIREPINIDSIEWFANFIFLFLFSNIRLFWMNWSPRK